MCSPARASFGFSDASLLCFDQEDGIGKCVGDSGGPSLLDIDGTTHVVGVTSFGDQNCAIFGSDTRVNAQTAFIDGVLAALDLDCDSDGTCQAGCGVGAAPADPDCPVCVADAICTAGCGAEGNPADPDCACPAAGKARPISTASPKQRRM